ncbi:DNA-3-methyladenine glycosylase I [Weissella uvarum]|uniref:DNA-3-methyladenine glycosylase I n=1 Tax=Weissella uvarum TaxID=1479233 RepID=UPI00195FFFC0|nr:DNA-3-methyladenine glycosylase I [Weissella uvarum]MBM7616586.1 DNA-3-methyladenine glycosylase I [Weissella uvarum]MCM0594955.1 DNA-3-methyladenine glycosylase I [Weissella uvarum]
MGDNITRCAWGQIEINQQYHDTEWGRPEHDNRRLFEALTLEIMQAGLSWQTIMKKRDNFRNAFANWDYATVANYDEKQVELLLRDAGIIRHRKKIEATIANAQAIVNLAPMTFDEYVWQYTDGRTLMNHWADEHQVPSTTVLAQTMSKQFKADGFQFVGPKTMYAFMQAVGMVNDHIETCDFKYIGE